MGKNKIHILPAKHVKLDTAVRIVNEKGCILRKDILNTALRADRVVRISMHISKNSPYDCRLSTDSPYVRISEIKGTDLLGEILAEYRALPEHYYPLRTGERIWFAKSNIIEIPKLSADELQKYATKEYVAYTGPLETIDHSDESDTDSDADEQSESSSSDEDRVLDLAGKNKLTPVPRGRHPT